MGGRLKGKIVCICTTALNEAVNLAVVVEVGSRVVQHQRKQRT